MSYFTVAIGIALLVTQLDSRCLAKFTDQHLATGVIKSISHYSIQLRILTFLVIMGTCNMIEHS